MWRTIIIALFLSWFTTAASAQELRWETCRGGADSRGPVLGDCRPLEGVIDPQGREMWIRSTLAAPTEDRPEALYIAGIVSSEIWLNGVRLGANGRPGDSAETEVPGRYQTAFLIQDSIWRPQGNVLVVHLSSFHGGLRLDQPVGALMVAPYPLATRSAFLALTFVAAGALFAAAFGFGVIHLMRRTGSSLTLAAMAGVAGLQAIVESLRSLYPYAYPFHVWRLSGIWLLAAAFSVLLAAYAASRFFPKARRTLTGIALVAVASTLLVPGFDLKAGWALIIGASLAAVATAVGVHRRRPGARPGLAWLALFLSVGLLFPMWLLDLSFFLLAASLILPLLMVEVIRLSREDQGREAALTRAADQPDRLTVASSRGVELVPIVDIIAVVGADDYVELQLTDGRCLLHAARLDRLEIELPTGFLRIHRSVIANLAQATGYVRKGGRWTLLMQDGDALPISRRRLPALRETLGEGTTNGDAA
ncbi:MAG: LytTR family DNA-binding domain-containing protein [Pseudomonadota bacterium]|nr:LytTR family DNA-binding domain-containing protein [Pseudomonadota bacterium]